MPRKASGQPKTKLVERRQANGDIYVYEVTTLYNPEKRYNEHVSSKLLGKKSSNGTDLLPTRPRKAPGTAALTANRKTVGVTDILEWIGRESSIDDDGRQSWGADPPYTFDIWVNGNLRRPTV